MMTPDSRVFPYRWGAQFSRVGEARFRIWAPALDRLDLVLAGKAAPMTRSEDGWFELVANGVEHGQEYFFRLPDGSTVPDPAARAQAGDVHGPSLVIDPTRYLWRNAGWRGRPWHEAVFYELHVGTFTEEGTFAAAERRLGYLADLGVTAIELMPVAQFGGRRGWGYDGVLLYAPHNAHGTPDELKSLIDAAHGHGLMVFLDVVYNHFGPDGNYLGRYAPDFFHPERHTPWGVAIAYEKPPVRQFFIDNALYWLEEFQLDGLRLDAVDHIHDDLSDEELLVELARRVRTEFPGRHVHLTTEDNRNVTRLHERGPGGEVLLCSGEWNDDFHNVAHVVATGETESYYADFADAPVAKLARAFAEGFVYQGETSAHEGGKPRGKPSAHLPPTVFVNFLQNHDQVGNRAVGERLVSLAKEPRLPELLHAALILSPHIPLLFMGEEYGETRPFLFFTDFHGELGKLVRDGRRKEFAGFAGHAAEDVPDPNALATFEASKLDWNRLETSAGRDALAATRHLLHLRRQRIMPLLASGTSRGGSVIACTDGALAVDWQLDGATLSLRLNLIAEPVALPPAPGETIHAAGGEADGNGGMMPPFSIAVSLSAA